MRVCVCVCVCGRSVLLVRIGSDNSPSSGSGGDRIQSQVCSGSKLTRFIQGRDCSVNISRSTIYTALGIAFRVRDRVRISVSVRDSGRD